MYRFNAMTTSNIPATPGANLRPKQDDQPGMDKPVRETTSCLM